MNLRRVSPAMRGLRASTLLLCGVVFIQLLAAQVDAQRSRRRSPWQTLTGNAPLVIARGGFSGLLPDSSIDAYGLAKQTSVPNVVLWCDVQLTKDGVGICFPDINLGNASDISEVYPKQQNSYLVNGVSTQGWFSIDFTLKDLSKVFLIRGIYSRPIAFDYKYLIQTVEDVATIVKPPGFWLNIQHDAFYTHHNLSMRNFVLTVSQSVAIDYISSPEVNFLRSIAGRFGRSGPKFVFQFLRQEDVEPLTNQTYGALLQNLTFIKTFASGILVPKNYIWPVSRLYLSQPTTLVQDAHKAGLEVYASGFANDFDFAYNYSFDPVAEYLSFIDGNFSVDGVLSDFPITASAAVECFSHLGENATKQVDFLVISKNGASGDYPGCTTVAYDKAIKDGADIIDCSVQMSMDGVPFCLSSIDLGNNTMVAQSNLSSRSTSVPEISAVAGTYTFSLTWAEIHNLTPAIANPFRSSGELLRNPREANAGKLMSLSDFLNLAKDTSSLTGVLLSVEKAAYLREKQGLDVIKAVLDTLGEAGYNNGTTKRVMIQSSDSSVLIDIKQKSRYETVYKIEEPIRDILESAIEDIKKFANSVVIRKHSVISVGDGITLGQTEVVTKLQKLQLPVYVELFQNEFISQPYDFFSDATMEINSYVSGIGINGTITEFPLTAARYKRSRCLGLKDPPIYSSSVQPGGLLPLTVAMPPAEAPNPVFTEADVTEPPLPAVTARAPASTPGNSTNGAQVPSGQARVAQSRLLSVLPVLLASLLLL